MHSIEAYADWAINVIDPDIGDRDDWADVINAAKGTSEPDGQVASVTLNSNFSDTLLLTWATGQFQSIPNYARITGLEATVRMKADSAGLGPEDPARSIQLWNDFTQPLRLAGSRVGLASGPGAAITLSTSLQTLVYGGPGYFGVNESGVSAQSLITPTYIKTLLWVGVYGAASNAWTLSVDSLKLKVYWVNPGGIRQRLGGSRRGLGPR